MCIRDRTRVRTPGRCTTYVQYAPRSPDSSRRNSASASAAEKSAIVPSNVLRTTKFAPSPVPISSRTTRPTISA